MTSPRQVASVWFKGIPYLILNKIKKLNEKPQTVIFYGSKLTYILFTLVEI